MGQFVSWAISADAYSVAHKVRKKDGNFFKEGFNRIIISMTRSDKSFHVKYQ